MAASISINTSMRYTFLTPAKCI